MRIWEPQYIKCPDCGHTFYWPCDPDDFYRCNEKHNEQLPLPIREAHPEVHEDEELPNIDRGGKE